MTNEEFQTAVELLLEGQKEGLRQIYEAYLRLIFAVIRDVVGRKEDAEDITSEFFIKLIRVLPSYKKGSPHRAWLITIARNMALDWLRKSDHERLFADDDEVQEGGTLEKSDESSVEDRAVLGTDMRAAMNKLDKKEKEIIDMKLIGELKFREIASITGQPIGTVTWLYNQGIKKLRRCLADYEG